MDFHNVSMQGPGLVVLPGLKETMIPDLQQWLDPERRTSVLIYEKEKTYNLDSKSRQD